MTHTVEALLVIFGFRLACLLASCFLAYLGFRLFALGLYSSDTLGSLEAQYRGVKLILRQVGPGVFFALFGVAIAYAGLSFHPMFEETMTQTVRNAPSASIQGESLPAQPTCTAKTSTAEPITTTETQTKERYINGELVRYTNGAPTQEKTTTKSSYSKPH